MTLKYLINIEDLKQLGLIHDNVDTKILKVLIRDVQEMQIQSITGTPLFKELIQRVEDDNWNTAYRLLMNDYILPCLSSWVDYESAIFLNSKITNKNVGKGSDEFRTANNDAETASFLNRLEKKAKFKSNRLQGFLIDNCNVYEKYKESGCYKEWVSQQKGKSTTLNWGKA